MEEELKQYVIRPIIRNKFSGQSYYNKTLTVIMGAQLSQNGLYKTGLNVSEEEYYEDVKRLENCVVIEPVRNRY